ncbi:MAG: heme o synthase, partial [bacterium]
RRRRMDAGAPGLWLRLTAVAAATASGVAVVSGGNGHVHRALAFVGLPLLAALAVMAWVAYRRLLPATASALALFLAALGTWWSRPLHLALAALAFAAAVTLAATALRGGTAVRGAWRDYLVLTKPRVMTLLLLTGAAGMFVGEGGVPALGDLGIMLAGLALACGGASALNHVLDRDIDRVMGARTQSRPVAAGRVPPALAFEYGLALSAASFVLLAALLNPLAALLALAGNCFYVLVYTRWLKRATPQNIVIGGAAGAVPPLVGWAAATGDLALPALFLFLVILIWTPPHFWALALLLRREYARAGVPMLPVVRGARETARQILLYTAGLVALTLVPLGWRIFGPFYLGVAAILGAGFLALAWSLRQETTPRRAALVFHYSLVYLAILFSSMAIDPLLL